MSRASAFNKPYFQLENSMKTYINYVFAALLACVLVPFGAVANAGQVPAEITAKAKTGIVAPFGYPSNGAPERVITVMPGKPRPIHVERLETVRIVDGPRSVTWTFDTLGMPNIPLADILPNATKVMIYVKENSMYAN